MKISAILLDKYPLFLWSFFLGLIIATVYVIYKLIEKLNFRNILFALISIMATLLLSSFSTVEINNIGLLYILFCGIIASSAMILPGISGSLILVILGGDSGKIRMNWQINERTVLKLELSLLVL